MKTIQTSANKNITIYDDLFTYQERIDMMTFMKSSLYRVSGSDVGYIDNQIYSSYNMEDAKNMGFLGSEGFKKVADIHNLHNRDVKQVRVNFSNFSEKNRVHQDGTPITLLYYANLNWELDWGGHTFFLKEDLTDIEYTSVYKPGRLVIFDGTIPHMIMSPSILATMPRFSFVIQYY